eukprot:30968-Pelagococcus_subviridis.AAC.13
MEKETHIASERNDATPCARPLMTCPSEVTPSADDPPSSSSSSSSSLALFTERLAIPARRSPTASTTVLFATRATTRSRAALTAGAAAARASLALVTMLETWSAIGSASAPPSA